MGEQTYNTPNTLPRGEEGYMPIQAAHQAINRPYIGGEGEVRAVHVVIPSAHVVIGTPPNQFMHPWGGPGGRLG
jgi:hypothetical protein